MKSKTVKRGSKLKFILASVATFALAFGQLALVSNTAAHAADIGSQLTGETSQFTKVPANDLATLSWGDTFELTNSACIPNSAQPGDTWTWSMPTQIVWQRDVTLQHDGNDVVDVVIENGTATFTLRPEIASVQSRCINFSFGGTLVNNESILGQQDLQVRGGNGAVLVTKTITVRKPPFHELPTYDWKQIWFNREDQCRQDVNSCLSVAVTLKAGDRGVVRVQDSAQANWRFKCDTVTLTLRDHTAETESDALNVMQNKTCSPTELSFDVNTAGLAADKSYRMTVDLDALTLGGTGLVTYDNFATVTDSAGATQIEAHNQSSYVGGFVTGASLKIRKTDAAGNDANTQAEGVPLPGGTTKLKYAIVNNGDQNLTNIVVTDTVKTGDAQVTNLECVFPDQSRGTTWAGPFEPKTSFTCTADLSGVIGHHQNVGAVAGIGQNGEPIKSEDPYWANNKQKVKVGNLVWFDQNANGLYDNNEEGIADVTLTISRTDGQPVTAFDGSQYTTTTTTNAQGIYGFENLASLPDGVKYVVTVTNPVGYQPTQADVGGAEAVDNNSSTGSATSTELKTNGAEDMTLDFGFVNAKVSVGDYVWWDVNRDGQQNAGEPAVADVVVNLYKQAGNDKVAETKTNAQGFYSFTNLDAGVGYVVEFVKPANTAFTTKTQGAAETDSDADLDTGKVLFNAPQSGNNSATNPDNPTIDAGLVQLNLVLLKELKSAGEVYPGDVVTFELTPSNNGKVDALAGWSVTDVLPAGLTAVEMSGDGYTCETATATCVSSQVLAAGATANKITLKAKVADTATGVLHNVAYVEPKDGEVTETNPLGEKPTTATNTDDTPTDNDSQADVRLTPLVSVGDHVWYDVNRDGQQTGGEPAVADVVVNLYDAGGVKIAETTTNADGFYSFTNLKANQQYTVEFVKPAGSTFTRTDIGDDATDSDADDVTGKVTFTAPAAGNNSATNPDNPTIDAGLVKLNLVLVKKLETAGTVYPGDEVIFTLTPSNEGPVDALFNWSVTDVLPAGLTLLEMKGDGYTCDIATATCVAENNLAAGATGNPITVKAKVNAGVKGKLHNVAYVAPKADEITETNPLGDKPTTTTNTDDTPTDNDSQADLTVTPLVSVGDYVWWDVNRDGQQTDGEAVVADVEVNLYNAAGDKVATTKTDDKGFYSFVDLKAGQEYTVEFVKPASTSFTTAMQGAVETDSNADQETGKYTFTAPADGNNSATTPDDPTIDAGLVQLNLVLVKKLETTATVHAGEEVVFTLTPSNEGPVDALAGWSVTDVLPAGLTLVEMTGEGYTCDNATATCVAKDVLEAGKTGNKITVKAKVADGVDGKLHNVAYVTPAEKEIVETNPLREKPTTGTNTDETVTDNDSQAEVNVAKIIVPQKPGLAKTGGELPLVGAGVAAMLLAAGGALVAARRNKRA